MKFNKEEVGSLIQRASELHERSLDDSENNLSLSEIESIADELGIPSRYLIEAALEKKEANSGSSFSFWGAPFQVDRKALVEGDISEEQWNEALSELQEFSGMALATQRLTPGLECRKTNNARQCSESTIPRFRV